MSLEELKVRGWLSEWKGHLGKVHLESPSGLRVVAARGREGVRDFRYPQYSSIAYEVRNRETKEVLARTEGRDALLRLIIIVENMENP